MPKEMYKPFALNLEGAIAKAKERPGFTKAWDALEEYAALHALLEARNDKLSPSFATLKKYAHACGKRLVAQLV
jgi:hypothetical protein